MQVGEDQVGDETREFLISGSRDKTLIIWDIIERKETEDEKEWGYPRKVLKGMFLTILNFFLCFFIIINDNIGHSHFISDL
jgi:hypothetical protein